MRVNIDNHYLFFLHYSTVTNLLTQSLLPLNFYVSKIKEMSQMTDIISAIIPFISMCVQAMSTLDIGNLAEVIFNVVSFMPVMELLAVPIL